MIRRLTDETIYDTIGGDAPVLVTVSSPAKCGDCRLQTPVLEELSRSGLPVFVLDVDMPDSQIAGSIYARRGVPFHHVFYRGEVVREHLGRSDADTLRRFLDGSFPGNGGSFVKRPTPELWAAMHADQGGSPELLAQIRSELPCAPCVEHFDAYLRDHPPAYGAGWLAWTVDFHNEVNAKLGKKIYSLDEAVAEWRR